MLVVKTAAPMAILTMCDEALNKSLLFLLVSLVLPEGKKDDKEDPPCHTFWQPQTFGACHCLVQETATQNHQSGATWMMGTMTSRNWPNRKVVGPVLKE